MQTRPYYAILLTVFGCLLQSTKAQNAGEISFSVARKTVSEGTASTVPVSIPLQRTGGSQGIVTVFFMVRNASNTSNGDADFEDRTGSVFFNDGVTSASGTLFVLNDDVSEGNETHIVEIINIFGALVGSPSTLELTIVANDDPYGRVRFNQGSLSVVVEENRTSGMISFQVERGEGIFGVIGVTWQITAISGVSSDDITPVRGEIVFQDEISMEEIVVSIIADNIPENDEQFTVSLLSVTGGGTLDSANTTASLTILENDSPIRFTQSEYRADESDGVINITITRGLLEDGSQVGPIDVATTVVFETINLNGSATPDQDYMTVQRIVSFPSGVTTVTEQISIIDDTEPEVCCESFWIALAVPGPSAELYPPFNAMIVIGASDNPGGVVMFNTSSTNATISEDTGTGDTTATFIVERSMGVMGNITIAWSIVDSQNNTATADFSPPNGNVTILDGESQAVLEITPLDDSLPETPEVFTVMLHAIVNGSGTLGGSNQLVTVTVRDSDDAYGRIEWGTDNQLRVNPDPRRLELTIARNGGSEGVIIVEYSITYLPPGVTDPTMGDTSIFTNAASSVTMSDGEAEAIVQADIASNAFLEQEGSFWLNLTGVLLSSPSSILPTSELSSPRIGTRSTVLVSVPPEAANGRIQFATQSVMVTAMEPEMDLTAPVSLVIIRSGFSGTATISWRVSSSNSDFDRLSDIIGTAGSIIIPSGSNNVTLTLAIRADDVPEIDETFQVELLSVSEVDQQISSTENTSTITISRNDNPDGIFQFSNTTNSLFVVNESNTEFITLQIERIGGSVSIVDIQYGASPIGQTDLFGATGLVRFMRGVILLPINIIAAVDGIPEINETFTVQLSQFDGGTNLLGNRTSVNITVLKNDDANGVFSFTQDSLQIYIAEVPPGFSSDMTAYRAVFTIQRARGRFGDVTVNWTVVNPTLDVSPTEGTVMFRENDAMATFIIYSTADNIPEGNETITVVLDINDGDGRLDSDNTEAELTILQNDDPIAFTMGFVTAVEGETLSVRVVRNGQAIDTARVSFSMSLLSAMDEDVNLTSTNELLFTPGQTEAEIFLDITDDDIPELAEQFTLELANTTGDSVIVQPSIITIEITSNDDPNGVFLFSVVSLDITEGSGRNELRVNRTRGVFGNSMLTWGAFDSLGQIATPGLDVSVTSGILTFLDGEAYQSIEFDVINDNEPELMELFEFQLLNVTAGMLASNDTIAMVTVLENDDPYGAYEFEAMSRDVEIPEDIPVGGSSSVDIQVERNQGTFGDVTIVWEILPDSGTSLPTFTDLLLVSTGTSLTDSTGRPDTNTTAYQFGSPNSTAVVMEYYLPRVDGDFSVSMWLMPTAPGLLMVKRTLDGTFTPFSVSLTLTAGFYQIQIEYAYQITPTTLTGVILSSDIAQSYFEDGNFHHMVVTVNGTQTNIYLDGDNRAARTMNGPILDMPNSEFVIGGGSFVGAMQDVRYYSTVLSTNHITILSGDGAADHISPITGYLTYDRGVTSQYINVTSKDDLIPEPSTPLVVLLSSSNNRGRIVARPNSQASLTVLKSDRANGEFAFTSGSLAPRTSTEGQILSFEVVRRGGTFGSVLITWETQSPLSNNDSVTDFNPSTNEVLFGPGVTTQNFTVMVADDNIPELEETFSIVLVSAVAVDNETSSTETSGASISVNSSQTAITVAENDYPYGLMQFTTSPPASRDPFIPAATVAPVLTVMEEDASITLYVVRAQGTVGSTSVEYQTVDGSATSLGANSDYQDSVGTLNFPDGVQVQSINIVLNDDSTPELLKQFTVQLRNPQGNPVAPSVGVAGQITVQIAPSDDAFGVFSFTTRSLVQVVEEAPSAQVTFTIQRTGGALGAVLVHWQATRFAEDVNPPSGNVSFERDQTENSFTVTVLEDQLPELAEVVTVALTSVTGGGRLSSSGDTEAMVTIQASDDPYGVFSFPAAFRPLPIDENVASVNLVISRLFGVMGRVAVQFATMSTPPRGVNRNPENLATADLDYVSVEGEVIFEVNQTSANVTLDINDDNLPELDESIFIRLSSANLLLEEGSGGNAISVRVDTNSAVAEVIITENDDARGIVEFSSATFNTTEPNAAGFLTVTRSAGSFGQITVEWTTSTGTAGSNDFRPAADFINIPNGQNEGAIPLNIVADGIPEFSETFMVHLNSVSGGASLGSITSTTVTILPNDDPYGALEFSSNSRVLTQTEPADGSTTSVSLTVNRNGGTTGIVSAQWEIIRSDGSGAVSDDIQPTSGSVRFGTGSVQRIIILDIQSDSIPEDDEVFFVQLSDADGGARITSNFRAQITISANDNPHGTIMFSQGVYPATEERNVILPLQRSYGAFGDLGVSYTIRTLDLARVAERVGTAVGDYFLSPVADITLTVPNTISLTNLGSDALSMCLSQCLSQLDCQSFVLDTANDSCLLYAVARTNENTAISSGTQYYEKNNDLVIPLLRSQASPSDFTVATSATTTIFSGNNSGEIIVPIVDDSIPELNETFIVELNAVEVIGRNVLAGNEPQIGSISSADVVILENDDAHGEFYLYVNTNMDTISVPEADELTVPLTIQRMGGTIGDVTIAWRVTDGSATAGEDYRATGASLTFQDGATMLPIVITILEDEIPERNEDIVVQLTGVTGGATIADDGGSVDIIIIANDGAAGVVGFPPFSRSVVTSEGEQVTLTVSRMISSLGMVEIMWNITGNNVTSEFANTTGYSVFEEGDNTTTITLQVLNDAIPEVAELYNVNIVSVQTLSADIVGDGAATIDAMSNTAIITIRASNNPHGIVELQMNSLNVTTDESMMLDLTIIREFGLIGAIRVSYEAMEGSLTQLTDSQTLATANEDFNPDTQNVVLGDGVASTVLRVPIIDDAIAELSEVFVVRLTAVELVDNSSNTIPPSLGSATVAQVEISPNDNPEGVIGFQSAMFNVSEDMGQFNLTVLRDGGAFGEVSVLYGIINLNTNAMGSPDADYTAMTSGILTFASNVSEQVIAITIIQDDIPENDEFFQAQLHSPTGGAVLGTVNTTVVTIEGNDDENGVFSFNPPSLEVTVEESDTVTLEVIRTRGLFGRVTVLYAVERNGSDDLSMATGGIVFEDGTNSMVLELTALLDNIPELNETYYVLLTEVIDGGRLASLDTVANVTILANQNPYGVFELITEGVNSSVDGVSVLLVEENQVEVSFLVYRSFGTFGEVNVTWQTDGLNAEPTIDYLNEFAVLTFAEGEVNMTFTVELLEDDIPEVLEAFRVSLSTPTGGATLGDTSSIIVGILTNDNAHGIIGFAPESLSVITMELSGGNGAVELTVQRRNGTFGEVRVNWQLSGDHNESEINPPSGEVIFADGVAEAIIRLVIQSDNLPELTEITQVELTEVTADGVGMDEIVQRGAMIDIATSTAVISVIANDFPHGQIRWVPSVVMIEEPNATMEVELTLIRESGAIGDIIISYSTITPTALLAGQERALAGEDYMFSNGTVLMTENATSASVRITILSDDAPEILEVFLVTITNVTLASGSLGEDSLSPRALPGEESVQVQISENDNARGVLNFDVDLNFEGTVGVQENIRTLSVTVTRSAGTTGMVGCTVATTPISAQDEGVDYDVEMELLEFDEGQNTTELRINIINDALPELEETFEVSIIEPTGGVRIGSRNTFTVTILRNDDVNGVFTFALDTLVLLVPESMPGSGEEAVFRVVRSRSFVETVVVQWAVSGEGRADLEPDNGTLVFPENVTEQLIMIRAINDNQPEPSESFTISLLSASNGGRVSAPFSASIVISASDDPMGVLGLAPYPTGIVVNEGEDLTAMIVRSAGTLGEVSAVWQITPMDTNTFQIVTDTVTLTNGQQTATIRVPTLQDSNPEIARRYTLSLVASQQAPLDLNATEVEVIVASSDYPHGVVQFQTPLSRDAQEGSGVLSIPVQRIAGLSGEIRVNYSLNPLSAVAGSDYTSTQSSVTIEHNMAVGEIQVTIINDQVPELDEAFTIQLLSVELLNSFEDLRGFTFAGDSNIIDMPPIMGANDELEIVILENDDARGVVSLDANLFGAVEGRTAYINMTRSGGTFGEIGIQYQITDGSARGNGQDYSVLNQQGEIVITQGQSAASILIPIVDDALPELQEQFFVGLTGTTGGASLGSITTATVIIDPSDDPSGVIRFSVEDQSRAPIQNPSLGESPLTITFTVERAGGTIGTTEVQWRVTGPMPGRESNDIDPGTLQGFVTFTTGQSSGSIRVTVLPDAAPEAEEVYIIQLVSASGSAVVDPSADTARLTISQRGNPFGTVGFVGEALQPQNFVENPNTPVNISLPIGRSGGNTGNILVFFAAEGPMDIQSDIFPVNGSVLIADGEVRASINISILSEDIPEMEEAFTVVITRVEGGAELSTSRLRSTFTIGSNDAPHGLFVVGNAMVTASGQGSTITRQLSVTVSRQFGDQGTVEVTISMYYNELPEARYVPATSTVTFPSGEQEQVLNFPIALDAFLSFEEAFNISIITATLIDPPVSDSAPEISDVFGSTTATITEAVANPLVGFDDISIEASINDAVSMNNVQLTVNRFGQVGIISVLWQAGTNQLAGVENGSIIPATGSIEMQPTDLTETIILTVVARIPHGQPEVFSVQLSAVSQIAGFAAGVRREAAVSIIEPYGIVQLAETSYLGTEGGYANVTVLRQFGSRGDIMITGVASAVTQVGTNQSPAQAVVDFPATPVTAVISDGVTTGTISIPLGNDNNIGSPKVFQFNLTSVERVPAVQSIVSSPRLASSMLSSLVVIADDEGGSGIFQFTSSGSMVAEDGSPLVQAIIARGGGNFGRVEVLVRTIDGRVGTTTSAFQTARSGLDYQPYSETLVFESGQIERSIILRVLDDNEPEILEYFTVELANPGGGALLANTATTFEVSIRSNDNPNGRFSLTPLTVQLDEEQSPIETISVVREAGLFGTVQINWRTIPDPTFAHSVTLDSLLVASFGSVLFQPNVTTASIELQLRPNSVPENGERFSVEIFSSRSDINITGSTALVTVLPSSLSVFQFTQASRVIVVTDANTAELQVERIRGIPITGEVSISTRSPNSLFTYEGITIQRAVGGEHYATTVDTIRMDNGESTRDYNIPLINTQSITIFRGFYIDLDAANRPNTEVQNAEALVILAPTVEGVLLRLHIQLQQAGTIIEIESVANSLANIILQGQLVGSNTQSDLVQMILDGVPSAVEANSILYSNSLQNTMLDIYNVIFTTETFRHQSQFFTSLQQFGYSLLTGSICPRIDSLFYTRSSFYMELTYTTPEALQGKQFMASRDPSFSDVRDYLTLPSTPISGLSDCVRVNFLTFRNQTIFFTPTPNLRGISLSIGIQNQVVTGTSPVTYRIYANGDTNANINVTKQECLRFEFPATTTSAGRWVVDDSCSPVLENGVIPRDYVDCQCTTFGEFAARREVVEARPIIDRDDDGKEWLPSGPVSCAAVMVVMVLIVILHVVYFQRLQQPTKIFTNLCISIFLFQTIALVNMLATDSASQTGCTVLGILTQLTVIAQFVWMVALAINFWMTFLGYSEGKEPLIGFILVVWAVPILLIIATILIMRFGFDDEINGEIYGRDFDTTFYLCYMPNHWVALVSTALPIVLCLMCTVLLFSHACIYWGQWEQYDDLYYYSYNYREVPRVLVFFLLIALTWIFGSLHAYLGQVYLLVLFQVLNYLQGLYALVLYVFFSWRTMRKKQQSYSPKDDVIPLQAPSPLPVTQQSLAGPITSSTRNLLSADQLQDEWDTSRHGSIASSTQSGSKRQVVTPPVDNDDSHLDDIMFMLKTGGSYSLDEGTRESYATNATDETETKPSSSEHYQLRRISIADTHL